MRLCCNAAKCEICVSIDPQSPLQGSFGSLPDSSAYLIQFLEKILNPSHLDKDTFDDFRELVANYVFSYYVNLPHDFFREIVDDFCRRVARTPQFHNPRSFKILRIIYRNLQRNQPTECPKLEVMRDDFVDFKMVGDMLAFIQNGLKTSEATSTRNHLPNLYRLMNSVAEATRAIWDRGRRTWSDNEWMANIILFVSHKMGL